MKKHYYLEDIISLCTYKHLSADEIFLELKKIYPTIAQASVYRNLERLIKGHVLNKIVWIRGKALYETSIEPHIHFVSKETGVIVDIPFDVNTIKFPIPKNFSPEDVQITIYWTQY